MSKSKGSHRIKMKYMCVFVAALVFVGLSDAAAFRGKQKRSLQSLQSLQRRGHEEDEEEFGVEEALGTIDMICDVGKVAGTVLQRYASISPEDAMDFVGQAFPKTSHICSTYWHMEEKVNGMTEEQQQKAWELAEAHADGFRCLAAEMLATWLEGTGGGDWEEEEIQKLQVGRQMCQQAFGDSADIANYLAAQLEGIDGGKRDELRSLLSQLERLLKQ